MTPDEYLDKLESGRKEDMPDGCYCHKDQGAGYTFSDEHGPCSICDNLIEYKNQ